VYLFATDPENIERLARLADGHGGAYPAVKPSDVADTAIVFPGDDVLAVFADLAAPLRQRIEHSKSETQTLTSLRDLLLPKLMSGAIRIGDAEKLVGEMGA
jgi:type I restriction enzyme S subunit